MDEKVLLDWKEANEEVSIPGSSDGGIRLDG